LIEKGCDTTKQNKTKIAKHSLIILNKYGNDVATKYLKFIKNKPNKNRPKILTK
jgi:hypothetical protein